MLRILVTSLLILTSFILQSTVFPYIEVIGVKPNTALIIIVSYGILRGDVEGAVVGFFSGLLQDIFFGDIIGLYAMLGMLTGFISGKPFKDFFRENDLLPLLVVAIAAMVYEFSIFLTTHLLLGRIDIWHYFRTIILPSAVYTAVLTIPLYRLMYFINGRLERGEKLRRKLF